MSDKDFSQFHFGIGRMPASSVGQQPNVITATQMRQLIFVNLRHNSVNIENVFVSDSHVIHTGALGVDSEWHSMDFWFIASKAYLEPASQS